MPRTTGTRIRGSKGVSKPKTGMGMDPALTDPVAETGWDMFDLFSKIMGVEGGGGGGMTDVPKGGTPSPAMFNMEGMPTPDAFLPGGVPAAGGGKMLVGKGGHERTAAPGQFSPFKGFDETSALVEGNFGAGQLDQAGEAANAVAGWDPFKGSVPFVGGGAEPPPMPMRHPGPPGGMGRPPGGVPGPKVPGTVPAASPMAAPPVPEMGPNAQEQALINSGQGQWGTGPGAMPSKDPQADLLEQQLLQQQARDPQGFGGGNQQVMPTTDALAQFFQMMAGGM